MEKEPKIWFISRPRQDYERLKGRIGSKIIKTKDKSTEYAGRDFKNIEQDHLIALYIPEEGLVVDIFRVTSKEPVEHYDDVYGKMKVHTLSYTGITPYGKCLNLKELVEKSEYNYFEHFPDITTLDNIDANQKEEYVQLNLDEYKKIVEACKNNALLTSLRPIEDYKIENAQNLSTLLDFYNSRTTSFANMLVAFIVGISVVTIGGLKPISLVLFISFSGAIFYCIVKYCYYADIAEQIRTHALIEPNYRELNIPFFKSRGKTRHYFLIDYTNRKPKFLDARYYIIVAIAAIITLFILFYLNPFPEIQQLLN